MQTTDFPSKNQKYFQIYLDKNVDEHSEMHLLKSMESFLDTCLGPVEDYYRDDYFLASLVK